jgi:hypothetical protein
MDDHFLAESDCLPNLNTATIAGKVVRVESLQGKVPGLALTISYTKHWPNGGTQDIPIRIYVMGEARLKKLAWMKPGEVALVHGEVTDKNAVYAYQIEWLSKPERQPGEDDAFLTGMQTSQSRDG